MNYYKECIKLTLEIALAIYIIIFGYAIWDNYDNKDYYIAQTNNNTREVQIYMESNNLILHNVSKKQNNTKLILKIDKKELDNISESYLTFETNKYNLKELNYKIKDNYHYYEIENINFNKYETKNYIYNIELSNNELLDYEFYIEII